MSLDSKVDSHVTIQGTARNAMAGAVVLTEDRTPVYLDGVERWERTVDGKRVSATGTLRRLGGDEVVNDKGEHSHGIPGGRFVLEQPTWTVD
ncbi:MAG: hypothetical protein HOV81_08325 [Kofleriaceae bacterium]|nr:hypothetical protein [Kofleriaceae bacterium]